MHHSRFVQSEQCSLYILLGDKDTIDRVGQSKHMNSVTQTWTCRTDDRRLSHLLYYLQRGWIERVHLIPTKQLMIQNGNLNLILAVIHPDSDETANTTLSVFQSFCAFHVCAHPAPRS